MSELHMRGKPHPTKRCPLHNVPLTYTTSGRQVVCTSVDHCRYYEKLDVKLSVRINGKKVR